MHGQTVNRASRLYIFYGRHIVNVRKTLKVVDARIKCLLVYTTKPSSTPFTIYYFALVCESYTFRKKIK